MATMRGSRVLGIAAQFVGLAFGLGILAVVWTRSAPLERAPTTRSWIEQLQARDLYERKQAAQELASAAPDDIPTVMPALIDALNDREASVRNEAALALSRCLAVALKVRGAALTEQARDVESELMVLLERDNDLGVRASAAFASAMLLRAVKQAGIKPDPVNAEDPIDPGTLARAFNAALERDPAARLSLLAPYRTLGRHDDSAPAVVIAALDDPARPVRIAAVQVLSQFARGVDPAVAVLLKEAEFIEREVLPSDFRLRQPLRFAAEQMRATPAALPLLLKALESPNLDVRNMAIVVLGRMGPDARPATPALVAAAKEMIRASEGSIKWSRNTLFSDLASTLVRILPAEETVAILSEALSAGRQTIREDTLSALGELGPRAAAAIPLLLEVLRDADRPAASTADEGSAYRVIWSLGQIAPPPTPLSQAQTNDVVEALHRALDYRWDYARAEAASALAAFGPRAVTALPRLRALVESKNEPDFVRDAACQAIEAIEQKERSHTERKTA
jgi:HEAT repeat protein